MEAGLVSGGAGLVGAAGGAGGGYSSSAYESASYSSGGLGGAGFSAGGAGFSAGGVEGAFAAADTNADGTLDQGEFSNFIGKFSFP